MGLGVLFFFIFCGKGRKFRNLYLIVVGLLLVEFFFFRWFLFFFLMFVFLALWILLIKVLFFIVLFVLYVFLNIGLLVELFFEEIELVR